MPVYHSGNLSKTDRPWYNLPLRPNTKDLTVPIAPRNLMVTSPYNVGAWDIRWDNPKIIPQNNGLQILGCNVYRSTDTPYGPYVKCNATPVTVLFFRDQTIETQIIEDVTSTLQYNMDPGGLWTVHTSRKPLIVPDSNGKVTNNISDVRVEIDNGDGQFLDMPAYQVNGFSGEITLISWPIFSQQVQQIIPARLPYPPNGKVRVTYKYIENQVLTVLSQRIFYKVTTLARDPNFPNDVTKTIETPITEVSERSGFDIEMLDYIWKEAIRRNRWILEQGGERVNLFIRKWMGQKCENYDHLYGQSHNNCMQCFPAGQFVSLFNGIQKPIEEISVGDQIMSVDGIQSSVDAIFKRNYDGIIYNISSIGKETIKCTEEHPFLVLKKDDSFCVRYNKDPEKSKSKCTPMLKSHCMRNGNPCKHHLSFVWVKANELNIGDYVLVPKPKNFSNSGISEDEAFLYGLFLAEGHISFSKTGVPGAVGFSLGAHEKLLIGHLTDTFFKVFNEKLTQNKEKKGAIVSSCWRKELAEKFLYHCGHMAHQKRLSTELFSMERNNLIAMLSGYFMGDGWIISNKKSAAFSTVSKNLAYQLELVCAKLGIPITLKKYFHDEKREEWGKYRHWYYLGRLTSYHTKNIKLIYEKNTDDHIVKIVQHRIIDMGEFIGHPIVKLEKELFSGTVYNFETNRNHTYLINNVVVHNCMGTSIVGGYSGPYSAIIAPPESDKMIELLDMGLHIRYEWASWLSDWPLIQTRDIIVRQNNERYSVGPVNPQGQRGAIFQQHFTMSLLDYGDIRYKIPITGAEDGIPISYDPYRETKPTDASPAINAKPEIPQERIIRGKTVSFENISY